MPYSEPIKQGEPADKVRKIARLAQLILDLRSEYERRPKNDTLVQIKERAAELHAMAGELEVEMPPSDQSKNIAAK